MSGKFNPFTPGNVVGPGMFTGRLEELDAIERCLNQTKRGNPHHFALIGERGIGKTSLLLYVNYLVRGEVKNDDGGHFNFLTLNIELTPKHEFIDVIRAIAREFKRSLNEREALKAKVKDVVEFLLKWEIMGSRYHSGKKEFDPYSELDELVDRLASVVKSAGSDIDGIVILIDEADKPDPISRLGEFLKLFTEKLVKRGCRKVFIGIAGLEDLLTKLDASHESSSRIFEVMVLKPLETQERKAVVLRGIEVANEQNSEKTTVSEEALARIANLSEGLPHFIQQFSFCAFEADTDNNISGEDVAEGAIQQNGAIHQLGTKFFSKHYFDQIISDDYRLVLDAMAEHLDGWVSRKTIVKETGLNPKKVDNALRALKKHKTLITKTLTGKGPYKLPSKAFAVWIKIRKVFAEEKETIFTEFDDKKTNKPKTSSKRK